MRRVRRIGSMHQFRRCTRRSRTSPSSSTARQSQNCVPAIITAISSKCHLDVGRGRRRRSYRANNGPNFNTHDRVPWRGVAGRGLDPTISGIGRIGQITMAGNPTAGSSLNAPMVSSILYRARWTAHSSFCSRRMARGRLERGDGRVRRPPPSTLEILHALRRGQIEAIFGMGFVAWHLIQFTQEALGGRQNASFYAAKHHSTEV
jgi:hypothetical protein